MRHKMMDIMVCPTCRDKLVLTEHETAEDRVRQGDLRCGKCSAVFAIRDFVPRFVKTDEYVDTFSFEWNRFHDVQMDILNNTDESEKTFAWKTGWRPDDMRGRLVLDVGVGAGRFADVVSRWGGEVVGIDLSFAVDAAYRNIGSRKNVHIVQADIFSLPFSPETFDSMYSIGVLHHTPDTRKAFQRVVPLLKKGGEFAVFLYAHGPVHYFSDLWRKFTTRLSIKTVYYLSSIAVPLYYVHKIPLIGRAAQFLLPTANWPDRQWRWLDTLDWYAPKYQWKHTWPEVYQWFREEGFTDIELFSETRDDSLTQICMRGRKK